MYKILFVEDDYNHIAIYKTKLELEGFEFAAAKTNMEAFDAIAKQKPDLILLDLLLIGENGLTILANLKKSEKTANIPVIVFTNYPKLEYKDEAMKLGANDFVVKADVTPQDMIKKIKDLLNQTYKNNHSETL